MGGNTYARHLRPELQRRQQLHQEGYKSTERKEYIPGGGTNQLRRKSICGPSGVRWTSGYGRLECPCRALDADGISGVQWTSRYGRLETVYLDADGLSGCRRSIWMQT
eukprot:9264994-Pyramimonas_sp.AAC.1